MSRFVHPSLILDGILPRGLFSELCRSCFAVSAGESGSNGIYKVPLSITAWLGERTDAMACPLRDILLRPIKHSAQAIATPSHFRDK